MVYDTIVVGHGPAGLTASTYLARANKSVLAIGRDSGVLGSGIKIENYFGTGKSDGKTLFETAFSHAFDLGVKLVTEEVLNVEYLDEIFTVETSSNVYQGKTIFLATGANRTKLNIKGFSQYDNKGINYCVSCDGYFFRGKKVGIIGSGDYMRHELADLVNITNDIIVFTNGEKDVENIGYPVITNKISEFLGSNSRLSAIRTTEETIDVDGVFVAIGSPGALDFSRKLGVITENGYIVVDEYKETNIKGLFAGGDIIGGKMQIIKASYDGMMAASGIINYLRERKDVGNKEMHSK